MNCSYNSSTRRLLEHLVEEYHAGPREGGAAWTIITLAQRIARLPAARLPELSPAFPVGHPAHEEEADVAASRLAAARAAFAAARRCKQFRAIARSA